MVEYIAVIVAVVSAVGAIIGAVVTGRANRKAVRTERTLPPYEVLAARVSELERLYGEERKRSIALEDAAEARADRVAELERRTEKLKGCYDNIESVMLAQQEWIKEAVALAEITGAIAKLSEPPDWVELDSESMRQRREEMRAKHEPDQ